ncbi:unnamed protein product, partial [Gulo gulo]
MAEKLISKLMLKKKTTRGTWVAQWVKPLPSAQGTIQ